MDNAPETDSGVLIDLIKDSTKMQSRWAACVRNLTESNKELRHRARVAEAQVDVVLDQRDQSDAKLAAIRAALSEPTEGEK
jgi:hypothetical protein